MHGGRLRNSALPLKRSDFALCLQNQQLCVATRSDFGQPGCCLHSSLLSSTILVLNCLFVEALCTTVALSALHLLNVPIVTHEYAASHIVNVLAADESK